MNDTPKTTHNQINIQIIQLCISRQIQHNIIHNITNQHEIVRYTRPNKLLKASQSMFPLSCAHLGRGTRTHKKTWSAHKSSFKKGSCTYFILVVLNIDECW